MLIYGKEDPDACHVLSLGEEDQRVLVELLGGTQIVERLASIQYSVEGLAIDWISVPDSSKLVGRTIAHTQLRTRTGVSVVAVLRDEATFASPDPEFAFAADDVAVVVGTPEGIRSATTYFQEE